MNRKKSLCTHASHRSCVNVGDLKFFHHKHVPTHPTSRQPNFRLFLFHSIHGHLNRGFCSQKMSSSSSSRSIHQTYKYVVTATMQIRYFDLALPEERISWDGVLKIVKQCFAKTFRDIWPRAHVNWEVHTDKQRRSIRCKDMVPLTWSCKYAPQHH
jgi:hypothetical protein